MPASPAADTHPIVKLPTSFLPSPRHVSFGAEGATAQRHPRKIVIAYEQTKDSDAFLDRAIRTGLIEPEDHIHIVHISQQSNFGSLLTPSAAIGVMPSYDADLQRRETETQGQELRDLKEDMLNAVVEVLNKHSFKHVTAEVLEGDPKRSLVDCCISIKPTFLATGTRGLGKLKSSILGSVSEYLARHCPCPVMIVKVTEADVEARKEQNEIFHSTFHHKLAKFGIHF